MATAPDLKAELAERAEACDENGLEASAVLHRQALARITRLEGQLANIATLIGNVDHSRGGGENAARLYGQMLNDIRTLADTEPRDEPTPA